MQWIKHSAWILSFLLINGNLHAQQKLENEIISCLIKTELNDPPPDTIFNRRGDIKKIKYPKNPGIVLVKNTQTKTFPHVKDSAIFIFLKKVFPDLNIEIYNDFKEKNLQPILIDSIKSSTKIIYVSAVEIKSIFNGQNGWSSYYSKYHYLPLVIVSRPGLNKMQNKALLYFSLSRGGKSGSGHYYFLELDNDQWKVKSVILIWMS